MPFSRDDEEAGAREAFEDAALYDHEYRRRRADITFYRRLAADRMGFPSPGPILDLACGSGRLMVPLLRDGHTVVGLDRSRAMLAGAARRVARLSATRRRRAFLLQAPLQAFALEPRFALAVCTFHSVQHLVSDDDLRAFFRAVRACLTPGGWFAFDLLPPDPRWIERDPARRWGRTPVRHPMTGARMIYTNNHSYDEERRALHMRLYYQPVDTQGRPSAPERVVRLCHRQLTPSDIADLLKHAGFKLVAAFAGFDGTPLTDGDGLPADEHIYFARRAG